MSKPRKEIDKERMEQLMVGHRKVFVRYNEGAAIYSMGVNTFKELAKDAGAIYRVKGIVLVNGRYEVKLYERYIYYGKRDICRFDWYFRNLYSDVS